MTDAARRALDDADAEVIHLRQPPDRVSLRLALVVEGPRRGVRLIVTIYNRDLAAQLHRAVPTARVVSMADVAAPSLAAACLAGDLVTVRREGDRVLGVRDGADGARHRAAGPAG